MPNFVTEADSIEHVEENVADAIAALIEAYHDLNQPLPKILRPQEISYPIWAETLIPVWDEFHKS